MTRRGSNVVSGWVNFPVNDPDWENTMEGGMVVKLVVCDNLNFDDKFGVCAGVGVTDILSNSVLADDRRPMPDVPESFETIEAMDASDKEFQEWESYHFPMLHSKTAKGYERYMSRPYLAALVLGSTGWSGRHKNHGGNWVCGFDDLSEDGKALYAQIQSLYANSDLHLLTLIDT